LNVSTLPNATAATGGCFEAYFLTVAPALTPAVLTGLDWALEEAAE